MARIEEIEHEIGALALALSRCAGPSGVAGMVECGPDRWEAVQELFAACAPDADRVTILPYVVDKAMYVQVRLGQEYAQVDLPWQVVEFLVHGPGEE